jgi:hypothetical protein
MLKLLVFGANEMLKLHNVLYANICGGDSLRFYSGQEIPRLGHSMCILCVIVLYSDGWPKRVAAVSNKYCAAN